MNYQLLTALAFMQSYDRDVLDLQDDPRCYIVELEAELSGKYPGVSAFDSNGEKVWPIGLLMEHAGIIEELPLWELKQRTRPS